MTIYVMLILYLPCQGPMTWTKLRINRRCRPQHNSINNVVRFSMTRQQSIYFIVNKICLGTMHNEQNLVKITAIFYFIISKFILVRDLTFRFTFIFRLFYIGVEIREYHKMLSMFLNPDLDRHFSKLSETRVRHNIYFAFSWVNKIIYIMSI